MERAGVEESCESSTISWFTWLLYWGGMWLERFGGVHMMFLDGDSCDYDCFWGFTWCFRRAVHVTCTVFENHMTFLKGGSCERTLTCYFTWQILERFHVRWRFGMRTHDLGLESVMWRARDEEAHMNGGVELSCESDEMQYFTWLGFWNGHVK
jgi:hypothetical protein